MPPIRIIVADDSVVSRQMLKTHLSEIPDFEVVAVASNGKIALERIFQLSPDLVILDIEMPEMDGLQALQEIRRLYHQLPVIMFSALNERDIGITVQALSLGADDYVTKPSSRLRQNPQEIGAQIRAAFEPRIRALTKQHLIFSQAVQHPSKTQGESSSPRIHLSKLLDRIEIVGIGISTGGPNALTEIFQCFPNDFPVPLVIVQHMPPIFTKSLADRLNQLSAMKVVEAEAGMVLEAGCAYIAPGDHHMLLRRINEQITIALNQEPHVNSCRPAVDVLFRSIAENYGGASLGVIMTGMGKDGLQGSEYIYEAGGKILAQDEASSTVWGMPYYIVEAKIADKVLSLSELGPEILKRAQTAH